MTDNQRLAENCTRYMRWAKRQRNIRRGMTRRGQDTTTTDLDIARRGRNIAWFRRQLAALKELPVTVEKWLHPSNPTCYLESMDHTERKLMPMGVEEGTGYPLYAYSTPTCGDIMTVRVGQKGALTFRQLGGSNWHRFKTKAARDIIRKLLEELAS